MGQHALTLLHERVVGGRRSHGQSLRLDRCAGGSSSGSGAALAARLAPLAIGTETDGSITCPSSLNGVAGIKPAVGTVSGEGVVPISASQDSAGPMARTVRDVAALYEVLTGLDGVVRRVSDGFGDARIAVASNLTTGHPATDAVFTEVVATARRAGVALSEVTVLAADPSVGADELTVLLCEMYDDLTAFMSDEAVTARRRSRECIDFENEHRDVELPFFGHEFFDQSLATGGRHGEKYRRREGEERRRGPSTVSDAGAHGRRLLHRALLQPRVEERSGTGRQRKCPLVAGDPSSGDRGMAHRHRTHGCHRRTPGRTLHRRSPG